ncbi:Hypothetical protein, putative [Bodo saltans]|uniref:Uncharacterized protein n=1 Tax=Bodo saltans TaxID=75058 RepID=A0A0S4KGQ0_BODSA|nr:Hypothetical protein, putative [Bodo saltans]|eukprot:CUI14888.1 Hypothetical protein, putative [Bodo saltans]
MTTAAPLPPIQTHSPTSPMAGGGNSTTPRSPRVPGGPNSARFGAGNPLTSCGSTIIGLGTVGLGDRSADERKRATRHQYDAWKKQKETQEIAERLATGGNTPKKPLTSKEMYVRRRNEAQERLDRRMEKEMELARVTRDDAARRKAELQQAQQESKEFTERFREYVQDENRRVVQERSQHRDRSGSPLHETPEERAARVQQSMSERRETLQANAMDLYQQHVEHIQSLHDPLRNSLNQTLDSRKLAEQHNHETVEQLRKKHQQRKNLLSKFDKERAADLKEIVQVQRTNHRTKLDMSLEKVMDQVSKDADYIRDHKTPRSKASDSRQEDERQRQRAEERQRINAERNELIQQQLSAKAQDAEEVRKRKAELTKAMQEDREESRTHRKALHDDCVRSRSPPGAANKKQIPTAVSPRRHQKAAEVDGADESME